MGTPSNLSRSNNFRIIHILTDPKRIKKYSGLVDFEKARGLMATVSGIRIEDDVLVTETGHRVLGPGIPEERDELEKIVGAGGFRFFER